MLIISTVCYFLNSRFVAISNNLKVNCTRGDSPYQSSKKKQSMQIKLKIQYLSMKKFTYYFKETVFVPRAKPDLKLENQSTTGAGVAHIDIKIVSFDAKWNYFSCQSS